MNMMGDSIPQNQLDSLSDVLISLSKGGLIYKPGSNALREGIIAIYLSAVDPKVTEMSALEMMSTKLPLRSNETSVDIKQQLRKEIRQFGRSK